AIQTRDMSCRIAPPCNNHGSEGSGFQRVAMADEFDFVVIGAGSGGLAAAQRAAEDGAKVAIVEPAPLGGTSVHLGCVPKKVMWNAADIADSLEDAAEDGFRLG